LWHCRARQDFKQKETEKMLKNDGQKIKESGKMMALTLVLTNFLLLAVGGAAFRLGQMILAENNRLDELTRGIILR
jgi:hypothetical protein